MKQDITEEQLNELTDDQKDSLSEWKDGDWDHSTFVDHRVDDRDYPGTIHLPLFSIGQMIEFLSENDDGFELGYAMCGSMDYFSNGDPTYDIDVKGLCDALWEAVKEILS